MPRLLLVAVVDHRRERRRLARTGGTDDQQQAALLHDEVAEDRRQVKRVQFRDVVRNEADHACRRAALPEDVDPETADAANAVAEVQFVLLLELLLLLGYISCPFRVPFTRSNSMWSLLAALVKSFVCHARSLLTKEHNAVPANNGQRLRMFNNHRR